VPAASRETRGIPADEVRRAARTMFPGGGEPGGQPPPESAEARAAVEGAGALARRAGLDQVGPAQLLGALALDPGSRARRVLGHLGASIPGIKRELECYVSPRRLRRRRGRGKTTGQRCSFCGKAADGGLQLVAGPGVWICAECVALAAEILAEQASGQGGPPPAG
jgi:hypothetical protein